MIRGNGNWGKMVAEDASKDELFSTIDGVIVTLENASTAVETQVGPLSHVVCVQTCVGYEKAHWSHCVCGLSPPPHCVPTV